MKRFLYSFLIMVSLGVSQGFAAEPDSLVAYWKFDEGSGIFVKDDLGATTGILSNAIATTWSDGKRAGALDFTQKTSEDTTVFVTIPGAGVVNFDSTRSFSISLLVKGDINIDSEQSIFSKGVPYADNGGWYHLSFKDKALRFMIWDDKEEKMTSPAGVLPDDFPNNEWVHVVCVRDRAKDSAYVYLNGELLDKAVDITENDIANDGNLYIGSIPPWGNQFFGSVDEFKVFNKALTPETAKSIASSYGLVEGEDIAPYLVANWKMDETSGTTVKEEINGADGELVGEGAEWISGVDGNAIDFANAVDTACIIIEDSEKTAPINFTDQSFSVSVWAKYDPASGAETFLFLKGDNGTDGPNGNGNRYTVQSKNGELRFTVDDNVTKTQLDYAPATYPTNEWVHFVGVRDVEKDSIYLYMNGVQAAGKPDETGPIDVVGQRAIIGNYQSKGNKINGAIDDVRIYNKALTAKEINGLFLDYNFITAVKPNRIQTLNVYPNPVSRSLNIANASELKHVDIYDLVGKLVKTKRLNGDALIQINTEELPAGNYIIKGYSKDKAVVTGKFIKM